MPDAKLKIVSIVESFAAVVCLADPVSAFEREWHLGGGVGFASAASNYGAGPALGVHGAYGISDVFDVRLELLGSHHSYEVSGASEETQLFSAAALLSYKVDIIAWVPHFGAGIGYYHFTTAPPSGNAFRRDDVGLAVEGGLDYAVSRHFGLGGGIRFDMPINDLGAARYFALLLRAEYRWGW